MMAMAEYDQFEELCLGSGLWPDQGISELCGWSGRLAFSDGHHHSYLPWASSDSVSRRKERCRYEGKIKKKKLEKVPEKKRTDKNRGKYDEKQIWNIVIRLVCYCKEEWATGFRYRWGNYIDYIFYLTTKAAMMRYTPYDQRCLKLEEGLQFNNAADDDEITKDYLKS